MEISLFDERTSFSKISDNVFGYVIWNLDG